MRPKCTFPGCKHRNNSHGLCSSHLKQLESGCDLRPIKYQPRLKGLSCKGPECSRRAGNDGLCPAHRWQAKHWGLDGLEFLRPWQQKETFSQRLKRLVVKGTDGCHVWTGGRQKGYGVSWCNVQQKTRLVHRMVKELELGRALERHEFLDHRCRNRACVNPEHLDVVTQGENTKRMLAYQMLVKDVEKWKRKAERLEQELWKLGRL